MDQVFGGLFLRVNAGSLVLLVKQCGIRHEVLTPALQDTPSKEQKSNTRT